MRYSPAVHLGRGTRVSVVIPVRDEEATLPRQLEALEVQNYPGDVEVIVADNGSTDATTDVAKAFIERLPGLSVVYAPNGRGPSPGRNAGSRVASGDVILFCDADDEVSPGWISAMVRALEESDVVGGSLELERLNNPLVRCWRDPGAQNGLPTLLGYRPFAMGANMGFRADVLRALGGFDERLQRTGEDADICWRAQLADYSVAFVPDAVIHYRLRHDVRSVARQSRGWGLGSVDLYCKYRARGAPRSSVTDAGVRWARLLLAAPVRLPAPEGRGLWANRAAYRLGRLQGSVERRTFFL